MSTAKKETNREHNSINWQVFAEEQGNSPAEIIGFEKPLLMDDAAYGKQSFTGYLERRAFYSEKISRSQLYTVISKFIEFDNNSLKVEEWLKKFVASENKEGVDFLLVDPFFRNEGNFVCSRLSTLFELMLIGKEEKT